MIYIIFTLQHDFHYNAIAKKYAMIYNVISIKI